MPFFIAHSDTIAWKSSKTSFLAFCWCCDMSEGSSTTRFVQIPWKKQQNEGLKNSRTTSPHRIRTFDTSYYTSRQNHQENTIFRIFVGLYPGNLYLWPHLSPSESEKIEVKLRKLKKSLSLPWMRASTV